MRAATTARACANLPRAEWFVGLLMAWMSVAAVWLASFGPMRAANAERSCAGECRSLAPAGIVWMSLTAAWLHSAEASFGSMRAATAATPLDIVRSTMASVVLLMAWMSRLAPSRGSMWAATVHRSWENAARGKYS